MKMGSATLKRVGIGPVQIAGVRRQIALEWVDSLVEQGTPRFLCFCEANLLSHALAEAGVRQALAQAEAVFADGIAMMVLSRLQRSPLPERIPGPSFLLAACEYGLVKRWRHFFYGGAPGVADRLAFNLRSKYPALQVAGTHCPPFRRLTEAEELEIKVKIESSRPHLLWVALGSPKQELWAAEHVGKIKVPVTLPVGAAFDFHAGNRPWAPSWVRKIGMEWAFRMFTGGRQTFTRNLRCVSAVGGLIVNVAFRRLFRSN